MSSWMLMLGFVFVKRGKKEIKKKNTEVIQIPHYQNKESLKIIPNGAMIQVVKKYKILTQ